MYIHSLSPDGLADQAITRDELEVRYAAEEWAALEAAPAGVPLARDALARNWHLADEQIAQLMWHVAQARLRTELRSWHMTAIANIVMQHVEKCVVDEAFARALEDS